MGRPVRFGRVVAAALAAILAAGLPASCAKSRAGAGRRPVPVTVATAQKRTVPLEIRTFGTVEASACVAVKAEVGGIIHAAPVGKGQAVHKGELLFSIDPRTFEADLKQAQANLARDSAQARQAQADAGRDAELFKKGIASPADHEKSQAAAEAQAAAVTADEAAVENAKLQLERCSIRSPIDGRAGSLCCDQGNLVKANDMTLVVINQIRPIDVFFSITQSDLPALRQYMAAGTLEVLATVPGQDPAEQGKLTFIDNTVDKSTGTILVGASFPNAAERLWPGQYVEVALTLAQREGQVVVPARAVQTGQDSKYVFVVTADGSAIMRPVKVGAMVDLDVVVSEGLAGDETVVTDGHLRLTDGAKVEVKASPAPGGTIAPPEGRQETGA